MMMPLIDGGATDASNVTVAGPLGSVIDAVSVVVPVDVGIVQRVVASPFASVTAVVGLAVPPPPAGVNVTVTPMTGSEFTPVTRTRSGIGSWLPAGACCASPATFEIVVAPIAIAVNVTDGEPCGPTSAAVSVCAPSAVPSVQVARARPFASLVAIAGDADPAAAAKVTVALGTGVSFASVTRTTTG